MLKTLLLFMAVAMNSPQGLTQELFKFNFGEFKIGTAEYKKGPTGCTVIHFPKGAIGAIDIRGGAAAVREGSSLDPLNTWGWADAVVLAGGSTYGLEAADGVAREIFKLRKGSTHFTKIPAVPAAIVYDYGKRNNTLYPDKALGAKAFSNAKKNEVMIGKAGAGSNVYIGKYLGRKYGQRSGQGAGIVTVGKVKVFAISVVNALGSIIGEDGQVIAGSVDPKTKKHLDTIKERIKQLQEKAGQKPPKGNTTITAIVTNAKLERTDLQRLAVMAHTSMGRWIVPFHTPSDGDVLFAFTTRSVEMPKEMDVSDLSLMAADALRQAIHSAIK